MNDKYYVVILRNAKDGYIKSVNVVPSLESYLGEVRAFVHNNPTNALAMFAEDWEIAYKTLDLGSPDWVEDIETIPLSSWKTTWKPTAKDGE